MELFWELLTILRKKAPRLMLVRVLNMPIMVMYGNGKYDNGKYDDYWKWIQATWNREDTKFNSSAITNDLFAWVWPFCGVYRVNMLEWWWLLWMVIKLNDFGEHLAWDYSVLTSDWFPAYPNKNLIDFLQNENQSHFCKFYLVHSWIFCPIQV